MGSGGSHSQPGLAPASPPMGSGGHSPALAPASPPVVGSQPGLVPGETGGGIPVPAITGGGSNPDYPQLPVPPSSGGHQTAPIVDQPITGGSDVPDYGSLPGAGEGGGNPGGSLQCDPLLNPC